MRPFRLMTPNPSLAANRLTGLGFRPALPVNRAGLQHVPLVVSTLPIASAFALVIGLLAVMCWTYRDGLARHLGDVVDGLRAGVSGLGS